MTTITMVIDTTKMPDSVFKRMAEAKTGMDAVWILAGEWGTEKKYIPSKHHFMKYAVDVEDEGKA